MLPFKQNVIETRWSTYTIAEHIDVDLLLSSSHRDHNFSDGSLRYLAKYYGFTVFIWKYRVFYGNINGFNFIYIYVYIYL
jgi:hypothetical protein